LTVHFRSDTDEWPTPQQLFDQLHAEFRFTLDVCANAENAKCARYFDREADGLAQDWSGERVWMNPPFGHDIKHWMKKAFETGTPAAPVVCLVPARTDTRWWHRYAMKAGEIRLLDKRLQFIGAKQKAPFPAALVVFGPPGFRVTALKVPT
jgi:site-specific DNA-methyltransferase (adenine-specific)